MNESKYEQQYLRPVPTISTYLETPISQLVHIANMQATCTKEHYERAIFLRIGIWPPLIWLWNLHLSDLMDVLLIKKKTIPVTEVAQLCTRVSCYSLYIRQQAGSGYTVLWRKRTLSIEVGDGDETKTILRFLTVLGDILRVSVDLVGSPELLRGGTKAWAGAVILQTVMILVYIFLTLYSSSASNRPLMMLHVFSISLLNVIELYRYSNKLFIFLCCIKDRTFSFYALHFTFRMYCILVNIFRYIYIAYIFFVYIIFLQV